jgi:predicted 3-demethylubiquinone-9 3-methyltransferase (glyoxalase superfamily)
LNGGPHFKFNEAVSFQIPCKDQAEVDYYWTALTADGGVESQCGWLKDKFGLSWQVVPDALPRLLGDPDPARAGRAMQAMLGMKKIEVDKLEAAAAAG